MERLEREIAGVEARLKETYDRVSVPHRGWVKPLAFRRSLQEVPKGPEPPKDRRRKAAVWAAAKVGFSRLSVFVSPEPIAFRRWTFSEGKRLVSHSSPPLTDNG